MFMVYTVQYLKQFIVFLHRGIWPWGLTIHRQWHGSSSSPCDSDINTIDSRYLEFQGTFRNTSRYPYFDISDLQNRGKTNSINHIEQIYV